MAIHKELLELDLYSLSGVSEKASEKEVRAAGREPSRAAKCVLDNISLCLFMCLQKGKLLVCLPKIQLLEVGLGTALFHKSSC
uniref:Uncharacterized protein n=1 Tax=Strix occidentalis caurina TaxID=311401 RepID=A0A8D0KS56_STROC